MPDIFGSWESLIRPVEPVGFLILRAALVYTIILVLLRWTGKREIGQLTPFDLVLILLVANAAQNAMVGSDQSITGGLISVLVLFGLNYTLGRLQARNRFFRGLLVGHPVLLIHEGEVQTARLKREGLTLEDLQEQMREHGIADFDRVEEAYLEPDGNFSFITRTAEGLHVRTKRAGHLGARSGGTDWSAK
jgi:uncharacterized membrane protein YcaP (DUF421 family)